MTGRTRANLALQEVGSLGEESHHEPIEENRCVNGVDISARFL